MRVQGRGVLNSVCRGALRTPKLENLEIALSGARRVTSAGEVEAVDERVLRAS